MLKSLLIASFLISFSSVSVFSQTVNTDSLKKIAITDVQQFKLSEETIKKIRRERSDNTSDFFKPTKEHVSNVLLLNDSTYIKAYREAAYKNIRNSKTGEKRAGIGTIGYVAGALAIFALIFLGLNQI